MRKFLIAALFSLASLSCMAGVDVNKASAADLDTRHLDQDHRSPQGSTLQGLERSGQTRARHRRQTRREAFGRRADRERRSVQTGLHADRGQTGGAQVGRDQDAACSVRIALIDRLPVRT